MMDTKLQISAELLGQWAEDAAVSGATADLLTSRAIILTRDGKPDVDAIRTLLRAAQYQRIGLSVFADLMKNEANIALKVGEQR
jgi:hypothetical protein